MYEFSGNALQSFDVDRSKHQERVGCAVVCAGYCNHSELRPEITVFTAELTAVRDALITGSNTQDQLYTIICQFPKCY